MSQRMKCKIPGCVNTVYKDNRFCVECLDGHHRMNKELRIKRTNFYKAMRGAHRIMLINDEEDAMI